MALKSTIFKIELGISDLDRAYYADHSLTLARHPSETDERLMVRVLAFALNASDTLGFGRGISSDEDADLWSHDLTGAIGLWIFTGLPDLRLIRKAAGRSDSVIIYSYGRTAKLWWDQEARDILKIRNVQVFEVANEESGALAKLASRNARLQCLVQDEVITMSNDTDSVALELIKRRA